MKICIIHGSNRKGNTDKTIEIIKKQINALGKVTYTDIYLPKDLPEFCIGCMACLGTGSYGGENCPHKAYTHPILKKLLESDGIVVGCPSYALAETAQIKSLFDHLACTYIVHRPNVEMFDKTALIVSTAAGAGTKRAVSTIDRNLIFWGIKRIKKCRLNLWAANWDEMSRKNKKKLEKKLQQKAKSFYKITNKRYKLCANLEAKIIHIAMKGMIKGYPDTAADKIFWKSKGWI